VKDRQDQRIACCTQRNLPLRSIPVNHSLIGTRANRINPPVKNRCIVPTFNEPEVVTVTFSHLNLTQQTATSTEGFDIDKMRALIAEQLHVDITRVTQDASFSDDLGASWLDRLELMIRIEDQFVDVEITDDDADQIEVVGDLIRYIEETRSRSILIRSQFRGG
jgi:acyl carrier protein